MKNNDILKYIQKLEHRVKKLENMVFDNRNKISSKKKQNNVQSANLDFSINIRAFMNKYAIKKSGPQKFVLLVAKLTKGEPNKDIKLVDIKKEWGRMSGKTFLGPFNNFYSNTARTKGWVDSRKRGNYCLTSNWKEIL